MPVQFNHTIVYASDRARSARFLAVILGRPAPVRFGPFEVVELDNGVSLDFAAGEAPIQPQHYAFLISEDDFDAILSRIREQGLEYWADPWHPPSQRNKSRPMAGAASTSQTRTGIISRSSHDAMEAAKVDADEGEPTD